MPPRRSARLVELANPHFQLPFPPNVVALLFSLLPLDARLRAREVCRGWRLFLEDASFWTLVDLRKSCGVNPRFLSDLRLALALLRAACVRAKGTLLSVDLSGVHDDADEDEEPFVREWLDSAFAAHKASLRDLVAPSHVVLGVEQVTALCRALPLCRVRCRVYCNAVDALPMLRREAPFALLTINDLGVYSVEGGEQVGLDLAAALAGHKGMDKLSLFRVPLATRAVVDALVDAAISAGIKEMRVNACGLTQTALPALTRLLQSPGFESLKVWNHNGAMFGGPALPAFCDALRNSKSLRTLKLGVVYLWADVAVGTLLIAALEGHPALKELLLRGNPTDGTPAAQQAAGECLAHLIGRSSSLRVLGLCDQRLGEAGMTPIFQALRGNAGLVELTLYGEQISADFARDVVLPAVLANGSLRKLDGLDVVDADDKDPSLREACDILEARKLADKDAA